VTEIGGAERNFEVVVGKVSSGDSEIRFAFVRKGTYSASQRVRKALDACGYTVWQFADILITLVLNCLTMPCRAETCHVTPCMDIISKKCAECGKMFYPKPGIWNAAHQKNRLATQSAAYHERRAQERKAQRRIENNT
jgi:hypothetical protein